MPAIGTELPTLIDIAKSMDPNGMAAHVVELLSKSTQILDYMPWMEGNLTTGHRTTLRTALPTPTTRSFNQGHTRTKSAKQQFDETCAMYSDYAEVDIELLDLYGGQAAAFRASEESAHVAGFGHQLASDLFFASLAASPLKFNGLATRYNDVNYGESSSGAKDGAVIDGGGTGSDNASIWLLGLGPNMIHGIHPKGMKAGLQIDDKGEQRVLDADNKPFQAYVTYFAWKAGLCVADWRYAVRIANLDVSNLAANSSPADLWKLMARADDRMPTDGSPKKIWCMNRAMKSYLREMALVKSANTITFETVEGRPVTTAFGVPIAVVDALGVAEAQLT